MQLGEHFFFKIKMLAVYSIDFVVFKGKYMGLNVLVLKLNNIKAIIEGIINSRKDEMINIEKITFYSKGYYN